MSPTPQTLQDYRVKRDAFIHDDRSLRRENVRLAALSVKEKQADEIIRRIRTVEETKVWKQDYADVPHPFPGMEFLTGELFENKISAKFVSHGLWTGAIAARIKWLWRRSDCPWNW